MEYRTRPTVNELIERLKFEQASPHFSGFREYDLVLHPDVKDDELSVGQPHRARHSVPANEEFIFWALSVESLVTPAFGRLEISVSGWLELSVEIAPYMGIAPRELARLIHVGGMENLEVATTLSVLRIVLYGIKRTIRG